MSEKQERPRSATVEVGQVVLWYPSGDKNAEPHPAIVTRLGLDSVNLNILDPNAYNTRPQDGVRHLKDPRSKSPELRENGAWDHTPQHKRFLELEAKLEALHSKVHTSSK